MSSGLSLVRLWPWQRPTTRAPTRRSRNSTSSSSCATRPSTPAASKAVERQRQQGKLLARERLVELLDPGSFVELDRYVRHREPELRDARAAALRRRGRHRLRDDLRPEGLRLLAGLHGLRRLAERGLRREDLQGDGPGAEVRLPGDRHQRLGRCAHPGRRRVARRATQRSSGATFSARE